MGRKDPVVVPPVVFTTTVPGYGMCIRIQVGEKAIENGQVAQAWKPCSGKQPLVQH